MAGPVCPGMRCLLYTSGLEIVSIYNQVIFDFIEGCYRLNGIRKLEFGGASTEQERGKKPCSVECLTILMTRLQAGYSCLVL
jgi:hypothetical protein